MLDYFLELIHNISEKSKKFLIRNKNVFIFIFISLFIIYFICLIFEISILSLENFFKVSSTNSDNAFKLVLKGNILYLMWILSFIKFQFLNFITSLPIFLFFDVFENFTFSFLLDISYNFKFNGYTDLKVFYDVHISKIEFDFNAFKYEYFHTKRFLKLIFLNSNLPVFFYFGVLFILSTILSLFFLSFLGLYGVFFLNLMTIVAF